MRPPSVRRRVVFGTFAVGSGVLWLASLQFVGAAYALEARAEPVSATLLEVGLQERFEWRPLGRKEHYVSAEAFFYYVRGGIEYESRQVRAFDLPWLDSPGYQRSAIEGLQAGAPVQAFVDPFHPDSAFLNVEVDPWLAGAILVFTTSFALIGALGLMQMAGQRSRPVGAWARTLLSGLGVGVAILGVRLFLFGDSLLVTFLGVALVVGPWLSGSLALWRRSFQRDATAPPIPAE